MKPRNARMARFMSWALRRHLRGAFAGVHVSGPLPAPRERQGVIVFANHPAWWDPAVFALLHHRLFHGRAGYGPMDADALQAYPLLERAGFMPVDPRKPSTLRRFVARARAALLRGDIVWITAEGRFRDPRSRPLDVQAGVAHLARHAPGALLVPLAIEYAFGEESRPDIFLRFGEAVRIAEATDVRQIRDHCTQALTQAMDTLAARVEARAPDAFQTIERGRRGVGGIYDALRSLKARLEGRAFDPAHAAARDRRAA